MNKAERYEKLKKIAENLKEIKSIIKDFSDDCFAIKICGAESDEFDYNVMSSGIIANNRVHLWFGEDMDMGDCFYDYDSVSMKNGNTKVTMDYAHIEDTLFFTMCSKKKEIEGNE